MYIPKELLNKNNLKSTLKIRSPLPNQYVLKYKSDQINVAFKLSNNSKIVKTYRKVFTETKEMRITHLRMQNPIPQGV